MVERIEKKLPSGAILKFNLAPFADGNELRRVFAEELKGIPFNSKREFAEVWKDAALTALSSKKLEEAIWKCLERATYDAGNGDLKITRDTFESVEARGDYLQVLADVGLENLKPFMKSLYAEYGHLVGMAPSIQP